MSTPTPRDELEMAAATPRQLARTLSEQRVDAKTMAAILRDADQRAAAGAPVPMLPRRAATVSRETTIRPPALAPRRMRSDVARAPQLPGGDQDDDTFDANTEFDERLMPRRNTSAAHSRANERWAALSHVIAAHYGFLFRWAAEDDDPEGERRLCSTCATHPRACRFLPCKHVACAPCIVAFWASRGRAGTFGTPCPHGCGQEVEQVVRLVPRPPQARRHPSFADPPPNAPVHPLDEFLDDIKANDAAELFAGDEEGKAAFLANVDAVRTMREQPSGIAPLIAMMERGTDDQKEWAAGALANLALDAGNRVAIAQAGGVPPLIALVEGGTDGQKERAAEALANLADDSGNRVAVAQAG